MLRKLNYFDEDSVFVLPNERFLNNSTSKGYQIKWFSNGHYIKLDSLGYESVAESLVSRLLLFSNLAQDEYIRYTRVRVYENNEFVGHGCCSEDFSAGLEIVSVANIFDRLFLSYNISYDELRDTLYDVVGYDIKSYLDKILCLDAITRNDDRHFNNIIFLYDGERYKVGPIFDNGGSCLSDTIMYPMDIVFEENIKRCLAKPFSTQFENQLYSVTPLKIDRDGFFRSVCCGDAYTERALKTIDYGLRRTEGLAWVKR